jgi:anti-anti-sigma factor
VVTTPFSVDIAQVAGQTVLRFMGELDMASVEHALAQSQGALAHGHSGPLVVDVSELTFCDSSGIRTLLKIEAAAAQQGRDMLLRQPGLLLTRIIDTLGLDEHFHVDRREGSQDLT